MWNYEKRLQFPVNIKKPDARAAQVIISQYGGPYISNLDVCFYLYNKMIQYSLPDCQSGRIFLFYPDFLSCVNLVWVCDTVHLCKFLISGSVLSSNTRQGIS